jgi:hypothetical protein
MLARVVDLAVVLLTVPRLDFFGQAKSPGTCISPRRNMAFSRRTTIFLKQGPHPDKNGQWALWHSNVIHRDTASNMEDGHRSSAYHKKVSLRECFLFLGRKVASGDFAAENPIERSKWWGKTGRQRYSDDDYLSPSEESEDDRYDEEASSASLALPTSELASETLEDSSPQQSRAQRRGPTTRSQMRDLARRAASMNLSDQESSQLSNRQSGSSSTHEPKVDM